MDLSGLPVGLVRILIECGIVIISTVTGSFIFGPVGGAIGGAGGGILAAIRTSGFGSSLVSPGFWGRIMPWLTSAVISALILFFTLIRKLDICNIWDYVCSAFEILQRMALQAVRAITGGSHNAPSSS